MLFITLLLISRLCHCERLSSMEMLEVFDEANVDFESVKTATDNLYGGAIKNGEDTTFGMDADVNTTDNDYAGSKNCNKKLNITDGTLSSDHTRLWHFNDTSADKIKNMMNNNLTDNNSDEVLYTESIINGDANVRMPINNAFEFYNSNTAYNNGNADRRTQPTNTTELVYYNGVNNNGANILGPLNEDMFFNSDKAYNNENEDIRTQFYYVTEVLTNNDSARVKTPHIDAVDVTNNVTENNNKNVNINTQVFNWFNNPTKLFEINDTRHSDSANIIKKPADGAVDFSNNDTRYNSRNAYIRRHPSNAIAEYFNDNESYNINNTNINKQPITRMEYLHNDAAYKNVNANIKEQFSDATEFSSNNNNNGYNKGNSNMMKQLYNKIEPSNNDANQNGGVYIWTPFTPLNSSLNGTIENAYKKYNESGTLPAFSIPASPFSCPEDEPPTNIGPYEVPTQRDMILHLRMHLLAMYQGFHTKAMHFLKDIKEATQASWSRKMFCRGPTELMQYRRCVRWVGDLSILTTKSLVTALETIRLDVATLIQGKICNISGLNIDPIHLLRILAAEKVSLEFALPDFLRQLHACARHCPSSRRTLQEEYLKSAHLTDQDFVLRHYFTQHNYNQQLKQQYKF